MRQVHYMLDIETFGTGPNAAVVSLGCCRFDPELGVVPTIINDDRDATHPAEHTLHVKFDLKDELFPGDIDASTVLWWLQQSKEAQESITEGYRVTAPIGLDYINNWVEEDRVTPRERVLWSNGPTFDETIMRSMYNRNDKVFPFHYRSSSCFRTIKRLAMMRGWEQVSAFEAFGLVEHHALHDALFQAHQVCEMYSALRQESD